MDELRVAIESVFRRESGRILASLIRVSGSFDLAEDALQDAFKSALETGRTASQLIQAPGSSPRPRGS